MQLGPPDKSGRPKPVPVPGSEFVVEADTAITAIGQTPRTALLELLGIKAPDGKVIVDDEMRITSADEPGWCFAGGDVINGGATVVEAVRDGKLAAQAIDRSLTGRARAEPIAPPPPAVVSDNGTIRHFQGAFRLTTAPLLCKGCDICVTGCPTETLALDASNHIVVKNANSCVFCGICEARCPDFAIWIGKETEAAR
jgi:NAD-dependent dihydropyrimidine dehydrogenase PreA subunit